MKNNRKIIYLAGFLFSISIALVSYINSSFLEIYAGKNYVGLIYILASSLAVLGLLKMPKVLNHLGNRHTIFFSCLVIFSAMLFLAFSNTPFIIISSFVIYFVSVSFIVASLDIFIEDFSKDYNVGSLRGLYLMTINLAWVLSQFISGSFINKISFRGIYLVSASFIFLMVSVLFYNLKNFKDPEYKMVPLSKTIKSFIKNKHLSKIYISNLILQFFYAWMVIYSPIYLHEYMNFGWDKIGMIFSIMLIPFVLVDFPLGKLSDKIGEKKILIIGYIVIILSTFSIPFIKEPIFWIWALVLFATRLGAATIEVMNESYFFKTITERNSDEISFFRNAPPIAYIIGPLLAFPLLFILPSMGQLFFILSAILLIGFFNILHLKDIK